MNSQTVVVSESERSSIRTLPISSPIELYLPFTPSTVKTVGTTIVKEQKLAGHFYHFGWTETHFDTSNTSFETLFIDDTQSISNSLPLAGYRLDDLERESILQTLEHNNGNKTRSAKVLGISIRTIHRKLNKWNTLSP